MVKFSLLLSFLIVSEAQANSCSNALKNLLVLYQDQNKEMMLTRISNAKDKHKFLRSFIPYYYKRTFELRESLPVFHKLQSHRGPIVGDAHVENFGFLIDNNGKAKFMMNDFDDTAVAPLFLDVLRLSQSASYVSEIKQAKLIEAYKRGLANSKPKFSDYTTKLSEKAAKKADGSNAKFSVTDDGPRFSKKMEPTFELSSKERSSIEKILKARFKKFQMHDGYRTMKESGGSAFGTRYHALVEIDGAVHTIEFKEIMKGGVVDEWLLKKVSEEDRVKQSMNVFLGKDFNRYLDVVNLDGKPYQIRFKLDGNEGIDLAAVKNKELDDVIQDEFYLLGQLHRTSLGNSENSISAYAKDLDGVKNSDWEESLKVMKKELKTIYNEANVK